MKVLFLLPHCPFPPGYGPDHHTLGLLRSAVREHSCDAVGFYRGAAGLERYRRLAEALPGLRQLRLVPEAEGAREALGGLAALARLEPFVMRRYASAEFARAVREALSRTDYDLVHVDQFKLAPYWPELARLPRLLVPYDAFSLKYARAVEETRSAVDKARVYYLYRSFARLERRLYPHFSMVCPVSVVDARWLQRRDPSLRVQALGIPVADEYFETRPPAPGMHLLCVGLYAAEAVALGTVELLERSLPLIRRAVPGVEVTVWGKEPAPALRACLKRVSGVRLVEWVDDYKAMLRTATVFVYPQACGAGIQTKVQHAMAMGLPVVARPHTLEPLHAEPGVDAMASGSAEQIAADVIRLLREEPLRREMGARGQELMRRHFGQDVMTAQLTRVYEEAVRG
jgi:glycosyltransferase involved in cell wall biosynthesis